MHRGQDFARVMSVDREEAEARGHRFAVNCNVGQGLRGFSFATWRSDLVPIPAAVKQWLDRGGQGHLVICGGAGAGKTHLAVACLRRLWDSGDGSVWCHDAARVDRDLSTAAGSQASLLLSGLTERRVLLLDGLEHDRLSPSCLSLLAQIATHRDRAGRSLLVTAREDPRTGPLGETAIGRVLRSALFVGDREPLPI